MMIRKFFAVLIFAIILSAQAGFVLAADTKLCTFCCEDSDCTTYGETLVCEGEEPGCDLSNEDTKELWGLCQDPDKATFCNPLKYETFQEIIEAVVNYLFDIAAIIAPAMIVLGAILFMTAAGNAERIRTAKKIILWTVVGFLVILFSKGLINLVNYIIGVK